MRAEDLGPPFSRTTQFWVYLKSASFELSVGLKTIPTVDTLSALVPADPFSRAADLRLFVAPLLCFPHQEC